MSIYIYHEWCAVDRPLTIEEQRAVSGLSSHIEVGPGRAVVTYQWSDFRHDPGKVLLQYFDAYFYLTNWGSLRLMFRFPAGLLDTTEITAYCNHDCIAFHSTAEYQLLDISFCPEDGGSWLDDLHAGLDHFVHLRADLMAGDYRLLYLAWLKAMTFADCGGYQALDDDDWQLMGDDPEPPVPAGLSGLSSPLLSFVRAFEIDPFLVKAAAEASAEMEEVSITVIGNRVQQLSREECDRFLVQLALGDPRAGPDLRKRLGGVQPKRNAEFPERRTIRQLLRRASELAEIERQRQAEAARLKHRADMLALAPREAQVWQQVESLLSDGRRIAAVYDEATGILDQLRQLSEFQDTRQIFQARLQELAIRFASRRALIGRWTKRGWL